MPKRKLKKPNAVRVLPPKAYLNFLTSRAKSGFADCAACVFNCPYDAKNVIINEAAAVCNAALAEVQLVS